jgi:hypothetical protein
MADATAIKTHTVSKPLTNGRSKLNPSASIVAVEMPPSQILRQYRLVAQQKTAHGAPWTKEDVRELRAHSNARTPLPEIAKKMKRTERALRRKAGILGIGLGHRR